jgi:outer membrane immunogenic protein
MRGSVSTTAVAPSGVAGTYTSTATTSTDWLFTFRGRLGWTVTPTALLYATGGLAVTDLKVGNFYVDQFTGATGSVTGASSNNVSKLGWTAGAGIEWALIRNWTAKVEYLYVNFGSINTTLLTTLSGAPGATVPNQMATSANLYANIVRAGINYRF